MSNKITIKRKKCSVCGDCAKACPQGILTIRKLTPAEKKNMSLLERLDSLHHKNSILDITDQEKCLGCGLCTKACRHNAISLQEENGLDQEAMNKNMITFPPLYFFSTLILSIAFYFLLPDFNMIPFPYNLTGMAVMSCGYYIVKKSSDIFEENKTTFYLEKPSTFIQNDYYRISRNPMYLGSLILISGLAVLTGNLISLVTPVLFFLSINFLCIPSEEKIMEKTFENEYLEYKHRVRRWI